MDDWSNLIEWNRVMVRCRAEAITKIWGTEAEKGAYRSGMKRKKIIWNLPHEYHFLQLETTECCSWLPHNASYHKLTARHKPPI